MSSIKENNTLNKINSMDITKNLIDLNLDEEEKTNKINKNRRARRLHSTHISVRPQLFLEEKEDILLILNKKQHKLMDYSQNKESISFSERKNIIEWCLKVLEPIDLQENHKISILHRFCTAYDYIMEKLFILNKSIINEIELKIFVINIFLLAYKMEGLSLAKLTISSLIDIFLKNIEIEKSELIDRVAKNEMKIIEMLDFNPQIFNDNNIHQLSYILYDLFVKKYSLKIHENEEKRIHNTLDFINKSLEFSEKILFQYFPFDKAMLSFYSSVEYCCIKRQTVLDALKKYNRYLRNNMNIIKLTKEDFDKYCVKFAKILYKNKM
jgi:hypothetical protein